MEDMVTEEQENNEEAVNPTIEKIVQFRNDVYERTLYRAILAFEAFKNRREAKRKIANGIKLLDSNLFKRASYEFQTAMELSKTVALTLLEDEFKDYDMSSSPESALAIGLVILKERSDDYPLANKLGNYARTMGDRKQANNLYRMALRIKRDYVVAFYNLAASFGNVDKYDMAVKQTIDKYIKSTAFITPEYQNDPKVVEKIENDIVDKKTREKEEIIKKLDDERKEKQRANEAYEVQRLRNEIDQAKKIPTNFTYEEVRDQLQKLVEETRSKQSNEEDRAVYHGHIFNLGLYAFYNKDADLAQKSFGELKEYNGKNEYLDLMLALILDLKGKPQDAREQIFNLLKEDPYNRYYNVNLGLLYRKLKDRLSMYRYLAVGGALLEKSDGLFRVTDIMDRAADKKAQGAFNKAISLYGIVADEQKNKEPWLKIGEIYLELEKRTDAIKAYKAVLEIDPEDEEANKKLREIHDQYVESGEEIFQNRRFSQAAAIFERALTAVRLPETVERAASVYRQLKKEDKVEELMKEHDDMVEVEREQAREEQRQELINKGRIFVEKKAYGKAIDSLEKAFRMQLDKNVLTLLAKLYKGLNRKRELEDLMARWEKMTRYEEEKKRKEKMRMRDIESQKAMAEDGDEWV